MNRALLALSFPLCCLAAEDVLHLTSGAAIRGDVRRTVEGVYIVRPSGLDAEIALETDRVLGIEVRSPDAPDASARSREQADRLAGGWWSCEGLVLAGVLSGDLTGSGRIVRQSDGHETRSSITDDMSCTLGSAAVRVMHGTTLGATPILLGAAFGAGTGGVNMTKAGVLIGAGEARGWRVLLGLEWNSVAYERQLEMAAEGSTPKDRADIDVSVAGPGASIEAGWSRRLGRWDIGVLGRLSGMSLSGSTSWDSHNGYYHGSDTMDASWIYEADLGLMAGLAW